MVAEMSGINDLSPSLGTPSGSIAGGATEPTVPIVLTTSLDQYAIPSGPYMVPVSWRRTHLSTLVNRLVSASDADTARAAIPFDFIVHSSLLRTTLGEYLESSGLTSESTLTIEYVRSTLPPTRLAAFEHDDWVASIDCSFALANVYMTSSYDGSVRLFSPSNPTQAEHTWSTINKATVQGGKNTSLCSAKWTPPADGLVTGGMDGRVQLWSVEQVEHEWTTRLKWQGEAHNAPVAAVDTAQGPQGSSVLSAGWDGIVAVWDDLIGTTGVDSDQDVEQQDDDDDDDDPTSKRRKTSSNGRKAVKTSSSATKRGIIDATMILYHAQPTAHAVTGAKNVLTATSRVTSVEFERSSSAKNSNRAWSIGYNGVLKGWDLGSGGIAHTSLSLPSSTAESRPMLSLTQLSASTLAVGSMDRAIHLFDTRSSSSAGTLGVSISNAHRGPIDALAAHPLDSNLFASASGLECGVKVWDARSSKKALFTLDTAAVGGDKRDDKGVLALDWSRDGQEVVAGGKDKRITVFRGSAIGQSDQRA